MKIEKIRTNDHLMWFNRLVLIKLSKISCLPEKRANCTVHWLGIYCKKIIFFCKID